MTTMEAITALEAARRKQGSRGVLVDLVNSNFRTAGLVFPERWYSKAWNAWRSAPHYLPQGRGSEQTRAAVAAFLTEDGLLTEPEQVILTAGSSISYELIFRMLGMRHRDAPTHDGTHTPTIALPRPGYPLFEDLVHAAGLAPLWYDLSPVHNFSPDPAVIEDVLKARPSALVLISPNNPTGTVYSESTLRATLQRCARTGTALICDEVFGAYRPEGTVLPRPAMAERSIAPRGSADARNSGADARSSGATPAPVPAPTVFFLNGLSKLCAAPEIKLGWIAVHGDRDRVAAVTEYLDTAHDAYLTVSGYAEAAGTVFLAPDAEKDRNALARQVATMRDRLDTHLNKLSAVISDESAGALTVGGIHRVIRIDANRCAQCFGTVDDDEVARRLVLDHGIYLHPGYLYGLDHDTTGTIDPFFIMTCLNRPEIIDEGISRLRRALRL